MNNEKNYKITVLLSTSNDNS